MKSEAIINYLVFTILYYIINYSTAFSHPNCLPKTSSDKGKRTLTIFVSFKSLVLSPLS